jgi:hypothetical protein
VSYGTLRWYYDGNSKRSLLASLDLDVQDVRTLAIDEDIRPYQTIVE